MAPTAPPSLKPARLDADAAAYANRLAEDWRTTGLAVGLDELPGGAGYVLTARSPSRTLYCECRHWRHRGIPLAGGRVWTIAVAVGRADGEPARPAGFAAGDAPGLRSGRLAAAVLATFAAGLGAGLLFFLLAGWW